MVAALAGAARRAPVAREAHVACLRSEQAELIAEADRRQLPAAQGYRSLEEWVADRLDVHPVTARRLAALSRMERNDTWRDAADGDITVDRALAKHRLARSGGPEAVVEDSRRHGILGVHRLAKAPPPLHPPATPGTPSRCTTSSPSAWAAPTTRTTWSRCAGTTTTW